LECKYKPNEKRKKGGETKKKETLREGRNKQDEKKKKRKQKTRTHARNHLLSPIIISMAAHPLFRKCTAVQR